MRPFAELAPEHEASLCTHDGSVWTRAEEAFQGYTSHGLRETIRNAPVHGHHVRQFFNCDVRSVYFTTMREPARLWPREGAECGCYELELNKDLPPQRLPYVVAHMVAHAFYRVRCAQYPEIERAIDEEATRVYRYNTAILKSLCKRLDRRRHQIPLLPDACSLAAPMRPRDGRRAKGPANQYVLEGLFQQLV